MVAKSVAVPCSLGGSGSNHSTGYAVDISVGCVNGQSRCNTKRYIIGLRLMVVSIIFIITYRLTLCIGQQMEDSYARK